VKVSAAIPAFNEEEALKISLPIIYRTLLEAKEFNLCDSFEILVINDGSSDGTATRVREFQAEFKDQDFLFDNPVRLINMRGNQGHMKALEAGYQEFSGDCIITLDADMQDPPEVMIQMIRVFQETKCPCVQAARSSRKSDTYFKRTSARVFYKLIRLMTGVSIIPHAADYRLLSRNEAKMIAALPEDKKIFRLLIPYFQIETTIIEITRQERVAGKSKYSFLKMLKLALDSLLGFSIKPLRAILYMALLSILLFIAVAINAVVAWLSNNAVPGWTTIALAGLFGYGTMIIALATIGEYVGRIYFQILDRPSLRYVEESRL
jgi:glycosyltransferase involved in cell wall biosynthesis